MKEEQYGRIAVYTPDASVLTPDTFKKPFMLVAKLPATADILGVCPLPNILDVLGMPSGGGPPGFSVLLHPEFSDIRYRLLAGFLPGSKILTFSKSLQLLRPKGVCVSAGLVVNYFEFYLRTREPEDVMQLVADNGYIPVPLVEYETPDLILRGMPDPLRPPV